MSSKGPEAFRTISEVAGDLDLPQHVLRFWETRFSQIRPLKRGGGRRYYRPDDVELLKGIRHLLYSEGYTIRGVQRLLKEEGPRFVTAAGRGTVSVPTQEAADQDEPEPTEPAYDEEEGDTSDEEIAPPPARFSPAEFRSVSAGDRRAQGVAGGPHLAAEDIRRLEGTLAELLELKRLLDQARG